MAIQDANWNVVALIDASQTVLERYIYDPLGAATVLDGSYAARSGGSSYNAVYLFQGGRLDGVTGAYAFQRRAVNPTLGRWGTLDPKGFAAGDVDLYGFVANTPTYRSDPTGLWSDRGTNAGFVTGAITGAVIGCGTGVALIFLVPSPAWLLYPASGLLLGGTIGGAYGYVAGGLLADPLDLPPKQDRDGAIIGGAAAGLILGGPALGLTAYLFWDSVL